MREERSDLSNVQAVRTSGCRGSLRRKLVLDFRVAYICSCGGAREGRRGFKLRFRVSAQEFVLRRESAEQFLDVGKLAEHVAVMAQDCIFCAHQVRILHIFRPNLPVRPDSKMEEMF
jgi:hypothetical protein